MGKTRIRLILFISMCFLFGMMSGHADPNGHYQEVGDVVYRDLGNIVTMWLNEHPGIYKRYNAGQPDDDVNHGIIHLDGTRGVLNDTLHTFVHGTPGEYYGAFIPRAMSREARDAIVARAATIGQIPYTSDAQRRFIEWIDDNGNGQVDVSEIRGLRSDGFVELVFALQGIYISGNNLLTEPINDNWFNRLTGIWPIDHTIYLPSVQRSMMQASPAQDPTKVSELKSTTHKEATGQWHNPKSRNPNVIVTWSAATDTHSGIDGYFTKWDKLADTVPTYTDSESSSKTCDDGKWYFHIRSIDRAGNWDQNGGGAACTEHLGPICIDTRMPLAVTNLTSVQQINTWYNKKTAKITTSWTAAQDDKTYTDDVSGIDGYSTTWDTSATGLAPTQKTIEAVTSTTSDALPDGKSHYFHIRSVDKAGNWDDESVSIGPFWIDATEPTISISIKKEIPEQLPSGVKWIKARIFTVTVTDSIVNNARSGLKRVLANNVAKEITQGQASWSGDVYVETPAWIKVEAEDVAGNTAYGDKINPDPYFIQSPRWENISDLNIPFEDYAVSPSVSTGVKDTATVEYPLEKSAQVIIKIYSSSGALIKTIKDNYESTPGTLSFTWDGKNASAQVVPDGKYYYVIQELDYISDVLLSEKHGIIIADNTLPSVAIESSTLDSPRWGILSVETNITESNLDDIKVYYKLQSSGTYNSITPQKIEPVTGRWHIELDTAAWSDGSYDVKVEALDLGGNTSSQVAQVNIQRATTTNVMVYDVNTGMDYQQSSPRVYIDYFLSRQANVKVEIYTTGMSLIKQVVNTTQNFGRNTVLWDGTNAGGSQVAGGSYKYKITSSADATLSSIGDIIFQKVKCYISCPWQGSLVRAYIPVEGIANGSEFKNYKLDYGEGDNPSTWTNVVSQSITPIDNGILGYWDTGYEFKSYCSPVPYPYERLHGEYTLRLTVTDINNNVYESRVTVLVGKVISNELGGEGMSADDKVHLIVEPLALQGSFEVVSIMPVDIPAIAPIDKILIGDIYELQPPMLSFSRPATLNMSYNDGDLGGQSEAKLGIYIWDVLKKRWKYLATTKDLVNNVLSTQIQELPRYHAYIAILADSNVPAAPVIFDPASPIYRESAYVAGLTEPQNKAELFNNGSSKGILDADYEYGYFSTYLKSLSMGNNALTAKSTDPAGNISALSSAKTIVVQINQPSAVSSIGLMTSDFSGDYAGSSVKVADTIYIELHGTDSSSTTIDIAKIKLATSITNPSGIIVSLTETGQNTGIYRGSAYIGLASNEANRTIGAVNNEVLTISAVQNPSISVIINVESTELIDAPTVSSVSHPSVCQNTFEDNLGEWANRSGADGATVLRDNTTSKTGVYSAKITNEHEGGDFSCYALMSSYYAEQYPVLSFDYKITPDVKTNFKVKVNGVFKNIMFTDDIETDGSAIRTIGTIENVAKDGQWHHADINLYKLLKADEPQVTSFLVDEIIIGDWDLDYWYTTVPGNSNALGATYWIDNFIITNYITDNDSVDISFEPNQSYTTGYSYVLDEVPNTAPDQVSEGASTDIQYASLGDGNWYLHVASRDSAGNWSLPNHYILAKDKTPPELISVLPANGETNGDANIELQITDNVSGVNTDTISLEVEGVSYNLANAGLTYNEGTKTLIFAPYNVTPAPIVFTNGQVINVRLAQAKDKAGNAITPYTWSYTYSVTSDVTPPNPPTILYPETSDIGLSSVTFSWIATDTSGIAGYSYILDGTTDTIPDDTSEGPLTEKKYSNLPESTYYFHLKARDNAGNWSETTHFTLNVAQRSVLVDDFNDGSDPNELGGASGVFDSGSGSYCHKGYVTGVIRGTTGYSIMLNYYTVGTNSYSGYWMSLNHANLTAYKSLSFWVKGAVAGDKFRVGLKDSLNHESKVNIDLYLKGGTSAQWQQVIIPLRMFKDVTGWSDMDNFSIVFENAIDASGDIYIEDIEFISENGKIVVDNFDDGHDPNAFGAGYYTATNGATMTMAYMPGIGIDGTYCYRITYSGVTVSNYCKLVMFFGTNINISDADTLSFYIKGGVGGERPNIHLYDGTNDVYLHIENYKTVTTSWQRVDIPLIDFSSQNPSFNLTHVRELGFAFEWETMSGTIYLDNVEFVSYALSIKPTLNDTPAVTKTNPITLSGQKSAGTSIWVNGLEIVPLNYNESWSASFPLQQGTNNLALLAKDSNGNESEALYRTIVLDTQVPIAVIEADKLYSKTTPVTLDGSASFDNYGIASYSWSFGDGTPVGSGAIVNHTYANSGTYNVTLTVTDIAGNAPASTAKEITVINSIVKKVGGANPDFGTIQAALNGSLSGNTIYVRSGTYTETMITLQNKDGLILLGEGADITVIEGNLAFLESDIEINGFTLKYGEGETIEFSNSQYPTGVKIIADAGVTAVDSELIVKNCIIAPDSDTFTETFGKGIQIWNMYESSDKSPTIQNNLIMNADVGVNLFSQAFGGQILGQIKNNTFVANDCGILLRMHKENPLIQDNIITDSSDSGIHITYEDGTLLGNRIVNIVGNDFYNNNHNVWCDAIQEERTPAQSNLYEYPDFDAYYIPMNSACEGKGYSLP